MTTDFLTNQQSSTAVNPQPIKTTFAVNPQPIKTTFYTPDELKILIDALNLAPSYLSKRFILKHLCGWSDEFIQLNARMKQEEQNQITRGDNTWR